MFSKTSKTSIVRAGALALVLSQLAFAQTAFAATGSPILEKRQATTSPSGAVRTVECLVYADGITIKRDIVGILTTEEKNFKLQGAVDAKIAEVVATPPRTKTSGPLEYTYSILAYHTGASGAREAVTLSSYNGVTGEDVFNPSSAATQLRDVINSVCGN